MMNAFLNRTRVFTVGLIVSLSFLGTTTSGQDQAKKSTKPRQRQPHPSLAAITDVAGLPRVLIIGDSISMGYTIPVRETLQGKANVHRPPTNCGPTTTGLKSIDAWLGDTKWDLIHFNWGLHDMKFVPAAGEAPDNATVHQVPLAEYEKNLRQLVVRLKQTGAKLIWRNTTPVPEGSAARRPEDPAQYNAVAAKIMEEHGIPTHDLHAFVVTQQEKLMLPQNVHFTPAGYAELASEVANEISQALDLK